MKAKPANGRKRDVLDPSQSEFGLIWQLEEYPYRLRAGDVFRFDGRLCRVLRVNYSCAVVIMNQSVRDFKTRFDKPVKFRPPPKLFRISPDSEVTVLNGKWKRTNTRAIH